MMNWTGTLAQHYWWGGEVDNEAVKGILHRNDHVKKNDTLLRMPSFRTKQTPLKLSPYGCQGLKTRRTSSWKCPGVPVGISSFLLRDESTISTKPPGFLIFVPGSPGISGELKQISRISPGRDLKWFNLAFLFLNEETWIPKDQVACLRSHYGLQQTRPRPKPRSAEC